ncbi:hypothetical protein TrCOL_g7207 [Triparma columacea]|uniref:Uncharacterized protein n=1 Tax=Triparma columacea TaxID=722753 RepID=A0A9W7FXP7_9STRA|nr:hypothetical protein TrCOL_g7207 [Triparma columacea]
MATKMHRYRSAVKTPSHGYCVATLIDDLTSNTLTIKIYSSDETKFVHDVSIPWPEARALLPSGGPDVDVDRLSLDKSKRGALYNALLQGFMATTTPPAPPSSTSFGPSSPVASPPTNDGVSAVALAVSSARSSYSSGSFPSCVDLCISAIKLCRAVYGQGENDVARDMYELMGDAYKMIGSRKHGRAANCYILCLKEGGGGEERVRSKLRDVGGAGVTDGEIESMLENHRLMGVEESWDFNCTGCGECCRTADNILLTPYDLFNLTRSTNIKMDTSKLRRDDKLGKSLKYMLKDDVPVCYLSPVNSGIGQCHFAYELVKVGGRLLDYTETMELKRKLEKEEEEYIPVTSDEYNLTEEEELEAIRGLEIEEGEEEEEDEKGKEEEGEEDDNCSSDGYRTDDQPHNSLPITVKNSYAKPALGCMLGVAGMPAMCAAYPIANESVWGDFWHGRDEEEEKKLDELQYGEEKRDGEGKKGGWVEREKFVLVKNEVCEGFFEKGREKTDAYYIDEGPEDHKEAEDNNPNKDNTVGDFLRSNTNLQAKEEEKAWFLTLHKKATKLKISDPDVRKTFVEHIARIWFNFDSLPTARNRPFKSWSRCKKVVQECTEVIIEQTEKFVETEEAERGGKGPVGMRYKELLKRLNL